MFKKASEKIHYQAMCHCIYRGADLKRQLEGHPIQGASVHP